VTGRDIIHCAKKEEIKEIKNRQGRKERYRNK
jgi:hypothetical protein